MFIFYCEGQDDMEHYLENCRETRLWFDELRRNVEERKRELWSDKLYEEKGMVLKKFSKARQVRIKIKWKENVI